MLANNEYKDFRTMTNDEFEDMDLDGREHEFSSNTFTELNMNAIDSIRKPDPIIVHVMTDKHNFCMRE